MYITKFEKELPLIMCCQNINIYLKDILMVLFCVYDF